MVHTMCFEYRAQPAENQLRDIVFLIHPDHKTSGSTVLRAALMAEAASTFFESKSCKVYCTPDATIQSSIVILHKYYLERCDDNEIALLKDKGNLVVADYIDAPIRLDQLYEVDALMASSWAQSIWLETNASSKPVFHVTHIVDPRIPTFIPPTDKFRPVYIGHDYNARFLDELPDINRFESTGKSQDWMIHYKGYNCHYAVRARQPSDGFKPFTKGFIAARCECPVIDSRDNEEAVRYLGSEYPYLADGSSVTSVQAILDEAASDFGGPRWDFAQQCMRAVEARSSMAFMLREFERMIAYFR